MENGGVQRLAWCLLKRNHMKSINILSLIAGLTVAYARVGSAAEAARDGVPLSATDVGHLGAFPVSNSMIVTWVIAGLLIISARRATRAFKDVPSGAQNVWEWLVEALLGFLEGIVGQKLARKTFWLFASIFIFVLSANWFGLLPGVGTIGWGTMTARGFTVDQPLLRSCSADFNMTFAMAMTFFGCWIVWAIEHNGVIGIFRHLFLPKGDSTGFLKVMMGVVFLAVGVLEVVSILFRPISLSLRLFGNVYAGEDMLETLGLMKHGLGWILPIPFYCMEVLVGLVQAMVFMLLGAVFTFLMCGQHEEEQGVTVHR